MSSSLSAVSPSSNLYTNSDLMVTLSSEQVQEVMVHFREGESALINKDVLEKIQRSHFFNSTEDLISLLANQSLLEFEIIQALIIEDKPLYEAIPAEMYIDPYLGERLNALFLFFFFDDRKKALMDEFNEDILPYWISPEAAQAVLEKYRKDFSDEKIWEQIEKKEAPLCIKVAYAALTKAIYGENHEQAENRYEKAKELQKKILDWKKEILSQEKTLARAAPESVQGIIAKEAINSCQKIINELKKAKELSQEYFPHRAEEYAHSSCSFKKKIAEEAMQTYNSYKEDVLVALKNSGANLDENEGAHLLPWVIGPEAFLFKYYNFDVKEGKFIYTPSGRGSYIYSLQNPSPYALEDEIRTDLEKSTQNISLSPRLISDKTVTAVMSEEVKALQKELIPQIKTWSHLSQEQQKQVAQTLYAFNKWDRYKTKYFLDLNFENFNDIQAEGKFTYHPKNLYGLPHVEKIRLTFHNLKLIIDDGTSTNPDLISTNKWLEKNFCKTNEEDPQELHMQEMGRLYELLEQQQNPFKRFLNMFNL